MEPVKGLGDGEALERERRLSICGEHCTGDPSSKRSERDSSNKIGMYMLSYTLSHRGEGPCLEASAPT